MDERTAPAAPPARPSLVDVARLAGVSLATASRVISGSTYPVSAATRKRVEQAAEALGHRTDPLAQAMATGRSRTIGVIVGAMSDPYFAEVTRGVEEYGRRAGYLTILCSTDRDVGREAAYLHLLRDHYAAGLVFVGGMLDDSPELPALEEEIAQAVERGMEIVTVAPRPRLPQAALIAVDDRAMLRDLADYLMSLGHRRLAFVGPPEGFSTGDERLDGLREALDAAGAPDPVVFRTGYDFDAGRRAALQMLQRPLPDAVIGFSDEVALGVLTTFRSAGVAIPEQVSIAGVDGTRESEFGGMTTVGVPMYELGAAAAARITGRGDGFQAARTILSHQIRPRLTTARRAVAPKGSGADSGS